MPHKPKKITILTLFPEFIKAYTNFGIIKKAIKHRRLSLNAVNLRGFGLGKRQVVDDRPYGGGVGMLLRADVVIKAINQLKRKALKGARVILLTPQGRKFDQKTARRLSKYPHLIFISGRYEGFDERVRKFADEELSIGDYVLMGGELPALVVSEAIARFIPGVLGKAESAENESFSEGLLEHAHYTKPEILKVQVQGKRAKLMRVPKVLLTGHHAKIEAWRKGESLRRTRRRRPDLLAVN